MNGEVTTSEQRITMDKPEKNAYSTLNFLANL